MGLKFGSLDERFEVVDRDLIGLVVREEIEGAILVKKNSYYGYKEEFGDAEKARLLILDFLEKVAEVDDKKYLLIELQLKSTPTVFSLILFELSRHVKSREELIEAIEILRFMMAAKGIIDLVEPGNVMHIHLPGGFYHLDYANFGKIVSGLERFGYKSGVERSKNESYGFM